MNMKHRYLSFFAAFLMVSGCAQQSYNKHQYVLEARRSETVKAEKALTLAVNTFHIDSAFAGQGLVSRISEHEYKEDYYHEFIAPPTELVTEVVRNWLSECGLFQRVIRPGDSRSDSFVLGGDIISFYGDLRDTSRAIVRIEVRMTLLERSGRNEFVLFSQKYLADSDWEPVTAEGLVRGLDSCLILILTQLEEDLRDKLSDRKSAEEK